MGIDAEFLEKVKRRYWLRAMLYSAIGLTKMELHNKIIRVLDSYIQRQKRSGVK